MPFHSTNLRSTSGHHFTALLDCPQKAWFKYHGNYKDRAPTPPYLIALQNEGLAHEREISRRMFPEAVKIPDRVSPEKKFQRTIEAMKAGAPSILQGYIRDEDAIGVPDVLELVTKDSTSFTNHIYRLGEFKRSPTLKTGHVLQVSWYSEILQKIQSRASDKVFFVLKDGKKTWVELSESKFIYQDSKKRLFELRASKIPPGPHLSNLCYSCLWRYLCMPLLIDNNHISLLPNIGRRRAKMLKKDGISSWQDLNLKNKNSWIELGFDNTEINSIESALNSLILKEPVFKYSINKEIIGNSIPVVMEIPDLAKQRAEECRLFPKAIWFEAVGQITHTEVRKPSGEKLQENLKNLVNSKRALALYGGTDVGIFRDFLRNKGVKSPPLIIDILEVVEKLVHCPFLGLELSSLISYIEGQRTVGIIEGPRQRIIAIKKVVQWLASDGKIK